MPLRALKPPIAMIFHVESEFAVENARFLRPNPEKSENFPENFRNVFGIFGFWVITRSPLPWILLKIGGNSSYKPPGAVYTKIFENAPRENQNLEVNIFELTRKFLTSIKFLAYLVHPPINKNKKTKERGGKACRRDAASSCRILGAGSERQ